MRQLRELSEHGAAERLRDALIDAGIEAEVLDNNRGTFGVWVIDEGKLARAQDLTAEWLDRGQAQALDRAAERGRAARERDARIEERRERQRQVMAERLARLGRTSPPLLTWGLIALCVGVAVITRLGSERSALSALLIVDLRRPLSVTPVVLFGQVHAWIGLPWDQPWRLVTPALVHFGWIHILFNMLWLRDLGSVIEGRHGARYLAAFTILAAALPNIAQLELSQNPMFGGMSGVVYGLLGLIWTRGRLDPAVGYGLSRGIVQFMLIWLVLGWIMPGVGVANWCHLGGLVVGVAWGFLAAKFRR